MPKEELWQIHTPSLVATSEAFKVAGWCMFEIEAPLLVFEHVLEISQLEQAFAIETIELSLNPRLSGDIQSSRQSFFQTGLGSLQNDALEAVSSV